MKKNHIMLFTLLLLSVFAEAQNIYYSTYFYVGDNQAARLYNKGEMIFESYVAGENHYISSVVSDGNGNVYWADNNMTANVTTVYKNGEAFVVRADCQINGMSWSEEDGGHLFEACCVFNGDVSSGVWRDDETEPRFTFGDGSASTNIENTIYVDDKVMWLDYQQYTIGCVENMMGSKAVCYRNGGSGTENGYTYNIGDETHYSYACDVALRNAELYVIYAELNDNYVFTSKIWCNGETLYTFGDGVENCYVNSMAFDGGDIYVCGFVGDDNARSKIWKNGSVICDFAAAEVPMENIVVNHQGIFTAGDEKVCVDGEVFYTTEATSALCVETECIDYEGEVIFEENFERGESNWACWTAYDIDDTNYGYQSYWDRNSEFAANGDYSASHRFGEYGNQEGWLVSPEIVVKADDYSNLTLSFKTLEKYSVVFSYSAVKISTSGSDPLTDDFVTVWEQTPENASEEWKDVDVDLTQYLESERIWIAFVFEAGDLGHCWFIDDVVVDGQPDGVGENISENQNVVPNPASDFIRLEGFEDGSEIEIYNSLGQLVLSKRHSENEVIEVSNLASGIYFLKNGSRSLKFVVE
ncbi:MAG: T9SS type A sorting domain-containing protein [Bacteroidales bacterium]|nr:T9SS type A sorting domain-containing protein [Bacteroidales bacterium]